MDAIEDDRRHFSLSSVVELCGLEKAPKYNGKRGVIVSLDVRDGRVAVLIPDTGKIVQALRKNLQMIRALIPSGVLDEEHASQVWDDLYVGDCYSAALLCQSPEQPPAWLEPLLAYGDSLTIVNCATELTSGDINLDIADIPHDSQIEAKWITSISGPTLVHCVQGRSRSVTVAVAILTTIFLQQDHSDALAQAWLTVTRRRPQASPNLGFRLALLKAFALPSDYNRLAKLLGISIGVKLDHHISLLSLTSPARNFALALREHLLQPDTPFVQHGEEDHV
uniref:Tyrosine specific protein phosphatases domain-containing protein n=1 Tax=Aureoumbra lagunensis TaxID=44058 RepID=A0A7S3NPJ2_9STRA|mmetsp:Transcript_20787/g.26896  ORF Transcript_20787/g.26896 Transcript_20787/m.26896 type:complete len:280 (+) Transcript_20787:74-913(+)